MMQKEMLRQIPSIDKIKGELVDQQLCPQILTKIIRAEVENVRSIILQDNWNSENSITEYLLEKIKEQITILTYGTIKKVINGTGIILHTGLGRAPFNDAFFQEIRDKLIGYQMLEFNLDNGKRGERLSHLSKSLKMLTNAEEAVVVNNNAAALILILNSIAFNKEVIVSRGQLIEIGGSFRLPDVIEKSGAVIKEIGTTNRTHISDYEDEISEKTGAILIVNTSNYKIEGFTKSPSINKIIQLGSDKNIPVLFDQGCGDFDDNSIEQLFLKGLDVICFSGDKILGGPQSGIILGRASILKTIHENPLYRALRCDKFTILALDWTLRQMMLNQNSIEKNELLSKTQSDLKNNALQIINSIDDSMITDLGIEIIDTKVELGSGSLPTELMDSVGIIFQNVNPEIMAINLRKSEIPIIGYIKNNFFIIDMKAILESDVQYLVNNFNFQLQKYDA